MSDEGHLLSSTACVNENVCLLCQMKAICFQVRPVSMEMYICCQMRPFAFKYGLYQ